MEQEQNAPLFGLNIDALGLSILRTSAQWAKSLSILGILLGLISFGLGISFYSRFSGGYYNSRSALASIYLIAFISYAVIFIVSAIFLLNFSNKITLALQANDQAALNAGMNALKNAIIFWTIVFIVFLVILLLALANLL
jgi:hypothetical protein